MAWAVRLVVDSGLYHSVQITKNPDMHQLKR